MLLFYIVYNLIGKTRTIATIADIATSNSMRILIIAPSNTASRRILESIHATGFENMCLIVSQEYFFEWHEQSYAESLGHFVHTKSKSHTTSTSHSHHSNLYDDFKERIQKDHIGKWTDTAKNGSSADSLPSVVIGTYGCIAAAIVNSKGIKRKISGEKWCDQVMNLLKIDKIDMIVVDETSQLWEGYGLGLFSHCNRMSRLVLVGDDKQLPPHGDGQIDGLQSLFKSALSNKNIPSTLLNSTFRLAPSVASLISHEIYGGKLLVSRDGASDNKFASKIATTPSGRNGIANLIISRFGDRKNLFGSLTWLHHESVCYKADSKSSGNEEEADMVAKCYSDLLYRMVIGKSLKQTTNNKRIKIVILTPYLEQKAVLEQCLARNLMKYYGNHEFPAMLDFVSSSLIVNTIDSFQGQEAEIVLISLVKSGKEMGFSNDQRRANVLLSRASQIMVIFGNALTVVSNEGNKSLLIPSMARYCSVNNCMIRVEGVGSSLKLQPFQLPSFSTNACNTIIPTKVAPMLTIRKKVSTSIVTNTPDISSLSPDTIKLTKQFFEQILKYDGKLLTLSILGSSGLLANWNRKKSLLSIAKNIPGIKLEESQNNSEWIISFSEATEKFLKDIAALVPRLKHSSIDRINNVTKPFSGKMLDILRLFESILILNYDRAKNKWSVLNIGLKEYTKTLVVPARDIMLELPNKSSSITFLVFIKKLFIENNSKPVILS